MGVVVGLVQPTLDVVPSAHVLGLFLQPHHFPGVRVQVDHCVDLLERERVELLEADNRHMPKVTLAAHLKQIVVDLAAAQHKARDTDWI